MTSIVLDASALLAVVNAEPGAEVVRAVLMRAMISAVNYSEVLKKAIERGVPPDSVPSLMQAASVDVVPFDITLARATAALYPQAKAHGLSLADRACLALGIQRSATVFTADGKWKQLSLPINVKLIRNAH